MGSFLKKGLLFTLLYISSVLFSSCNANYKSLEHFFIKTTHLFYPPPGKTNLEWASKRMDDFLGVIAKNDSETFIEKLDEMSRIEGCKKAIYMLPLVVLPPVSGLTDKEYIRLEGFIEDTSDKYLTTLQIAIKYQYFNIVHAMLLQNVEYDINKMRNPQNDPNNDNDLLMLAVTYMKNEIGLKILAALIAAGVTCDNGNYLRKDRGSCETPLTLLIKRRSIPNNQLSTELIEKGVIILINAGFDPYEERYSQDSSPFIQAVGKEKLNSVIAISEKGKEKTNTSTWNPVIAISEKCFGQAHRSSFQNDEEFVNKIINQSGTHHCLTIDQYKDATEEAESSLEKVEKDLEDVRLKLIDHRDLLMKKIFKPNEVTDQFKRVWINRAYSRLVPTWKKGPLQEEINKLEALKKRFETASKSISDHVSLLRGDKESSKVQLDVEISRLRGDKENYIITLDAKISRMKLWLGYSPFDTSLEGVDRAILEEETEIVRCPKSSDKSFGELMTAEAKAFNANLNGEYLKKIASTVYFEDQVKDFENRVKDVTQPVNLPPVATTPLPTVPQVLQPTNPILQPSSNTTSSTGSNAGSPTSTDLATQSEGKTGDMSVTKKVGLGIFAASLIVGFGFLIRKLRKKFEDKPKDETDDIIEHEHVYDGPVFFSIVSRSSLRGCLIKIP